MLWIAANPPRPAPTPPTAFDSPTQAAIASQAAETLAERAEGGPEASPWIYTADTDPMTDQKTHVACTTSTNLVRLDAPYSDVSAELCIRQSPRYGLDASLQLHGSGQIICRTYSGCSVKLRFGEGAQQAFNAAVAADGSSNIIFFSNASRFVYGAKGAHVTRVQITLYQAGDQVVEFNTQGLGVAKAVVRGGAIAEP